MKIDSPISANYYKIIVHVQYKNKPLKKISMKLSYIWYLGHVFHVIQPRVWNTSVHSSTKQRLAIIIKVFCLM